MINKDQNNLQIDEEYKEFVKKYPKIKKIVSQKLFDDVHPLMELSDKEFLWFMSLWFYEPENKSWLYENETIVNAFGNTMKHLYVCDELGFAVSNRFRNLLQDITNKRKEIK